VGVSREKEAHLARGHGLAGLGRCLDKGRLELIGPPGGVVAGQGGIEPEAQVGAAAVVGVIVGLVAGKGGQRPLELGRVHIGQHRGAQVALEAALALGGGGEAAVVGRFVDDGIAAVGDLIAHQQLRVGDVAPGLGAAELVERAAAAVGDGVRAWLGRDDLWGDGLAERLAAKGLDAVLGADVELHQAGEGRPAREAVDGRGVGYGDVEGKGRLVGAQVKGQVDLVMLSIQSILSLADELVADDGALAAELGLLRERPPQGALLQRQAVGRYLHEGKGHLGVVAGRDGQEAGEVDGHGAAELVVEPGQRGVLTERREGAQPRQQPPPRHRRHGAAPHDAGGPARLGGHGAAFDIAQAAHKGERRLVGAGFGRAVGQDDQQRKHGAQQTLHGCASLSQAGVC